MNSTSIRTVRDHLPSLEQFGVAVEYYPDYINLAPEPHGVDALLVSFTVRGTGRHWMNDTDYPESPGSLGITHYGEVHSIVTDPEGMDIYNLYLDPRTHPLPSMPLELNNMLHVLFAHRKAFRHRFNRSIHLHFKDPTLPLQCVQTLHQEMTQPSAGSAAIIQALLRVFLIACCRSALNEGIVPSFAADAPPPIWLLDTCRHLDEHFQNPITLDQLAGRAKISKGYLCRAFKKQLGLSVVEYLTERRIQHAAQLLQDTDDKILSVALDSGFGDLSHFNRVFKKLNNLSPSAYRTRQAEPAPQNVSKD
ncbi:MAG: helix-turn-helix transcriptional regulator [Verrucomicrobia bacterium]|jgi:AraC-like DNA-binding protein|nr:helix-turn-helix transcriptional regulator [Verrucomicrobiota bacterium]